jgi:glucose/arabinose dehydrogenase
MAIIGSYFTFSEVYGDPDSTKMACDELGLPVSETGKTCVFSSVIYPITSDTEYEIFQIFGGLEFPTTMDFIGDNMLVLEKHSGKVIRLQEKGDKVLMYSEPVLDVSVRYNFYSGMLGITALSDRVFLYYTESESGEDVREGKSTSNSVNAKNMVYQYDWDGEKLTNPVLVKEFIAQLANNHHGGAMTKGLDNEVYFVIGDEGQSGIFENRVKNSCYVVSFVNTECSNDTIYETGSIFKIDTENDNNVELFAMGIRNSFGLGVDPVTGYLWDTENGEHYYDEINLVKPRFNSGWNSVMGPSDRENPDTHPCAHGIIGNESGCTVEYRGFQPIPPSFKNFVYSEPEFSWYETVGPTAVAIPETDSFGKFSNYLFVGDYHYDRIYKFRLNSDRTGFDISDPRVDDLVLEEKKMWNILHENVFATGFRGVSDIKFHNGAMYVVSIMDGSIYKIELKDSVIPDWIKNNAGWWADGQIDDSTFVSGIQWLISNGVVTIPPTEHGVGSDKVVPTWIKNNAGWWADGQIDDSTFVSGLQWLISNSIMSVS